METELDKIQTTITIPLGLKNRIRKLKGSMTYKQYLSKLLRDRNKLAHNESYIEIQNLVRKSAVYSFGYYKVTFTYNEYNNSENFIFDIDIVEIRNKGALESIEKFKKNMLGSEKLQSYQELILTHKLYFELLEKAIQIEIEPLFSHKSRMEDYDAWKKEFESLGLSKKSFDFDVMRKLRTLENQGDAF